MSFSHPHTDLYQMWLPMFSICCLIRMLTLLTHAYKYSQMSDTCKVTQYHRCGEARYWGRVDSTVLPSSIHACSAHLFVITLLLSCVSVHSVRVSRYSRHRLMRSVRGVSVLSGIRLAENYFFCHFAPSMHRVYVCDCEIWFGKREDVCWSWLCRIISRSVYFPS